MMPRVDERVEWMPAEENAVTTAQPLAPAGLRENTVCEFFNAEFH